MRIIKITAMALSWVLFPFYSLEADENDLSDPSASSLKAVEFLKDDSRRAEGIRILGKLTEAGFAPAMHLKGMILLDGSYGVRKDLDAGFLLVKRSAELEYVPAMVELSQCYWTPRGTKENPDLAFQWAKKASAYANPHAWSVLGVYYEEGYGVAADLSQAVTWYKKSADAGHPYGQWYYGILLRIGKGVEMDEALALKYFRASAVQRFAESQFSVGVAYLKGRGVSVSIPEGVAWLTIASENGHIEARAFLDKINYPSLPEQLRQHVSNRIATVKAEIAAKPRPGIGPEPWSSPRRNPGAALPGKNVKWTGSGFIITSQGHIITNQHVAPVGTQIKVITRFGAFAASVLKVDADNDLSLLKIDGIFIPVALSPSSKARLGATVATIGFPNTEMQGFSPKLTKGEISSLAGLKDDPNYFQISVPVQPGNSGGALFDSSGNVIGVVTAKINQKAAIASTGTIAENVNYAVKSGALLRFLESVPEVYSQLPKPSQVTKGFEDVVAEVEKSAVLILAY
jgi:TPR repeat protein